MSTERALARAHAFEAHTWPGLLFIIAPRRARAEKDFPAGAENSHRHCEERRKLGNTTTRWTLRDNFLWVFSFERPSR